MNNWNVFVTLLSPIVILMNLIAIKIAWLDVFFILFFSFFIFTILYEAANG